MNKTFRIIAACLSLFWGATSFAADEIEPEKFSAEEEAAIEKVIKDYIMDNPEIVIEAFTLYDQREQERRQMAAVQALEDNFDQFVNDPMAFSAGNPNGDVTVSNFSIIIAAGVDGPCRLCSICSIAIRIYA